MDVAQGSAAQPDGGGHVRKLGVHQHYVRSVNGYVRACADGNAGVGAGQGRGVVDAVAYHGYLAVLLQLPDNSLFALWQHPGNHLVHTGLPANGFGGALVVTGQHHHPDAHIPQLPDGLRAVLLDGICNRDNAQQTVSAAKEEGSFTLCSQRSSLRLQRSRDSDLCTDKGSIAAKDLLALQLGGKAVARQGSKIGNRGQLQLLFLRIGQHCPRQRVLAAALQRGSQREQLGFGHVRSGQKVGDSGLAAGDSAGLVQRYDAGTASFFQRRSGLEQDAVLRTKAVAHHNSHRRCQTQRTGAADDQHRDAPRQRVAHIPPQQQPDKGGDHRNADDRRHEKAGYGICDLCNGGFSGGGIADHADDLRQRGVLAHAGGAALQITGLVGGGGAYFITHGLVHRDAFAGQGTLVHGTAALQHNAVHRDVLARAHHKDVLFLHLLNGHSHLCAVPQQGGGLGGKLHQALECIGGLALGARFQHLAHGDKGQNHGGRLKIELHHVVHD